MAARKLGGVTSKRLTLAKDGACAAGCATEGDAEIGPFFVTIFAAKIRKVDAICMPKQSWRTEFGQVELAKLALS